MKVYLLPLHIKLGLVKNAVKLIYIYIYIYINSAGFMYLKCKVSKISDAKIKEGVFVGPQIRELI
jgi:hypothetical protein